jgi:uncharacterized protein (TIGR03067 family)
VPDEPLDEHLGGTLDLSYTYRGVIPRAGKELAVLDIAGKIRADQLVVSVQGTARGRALVDVASGRAVSVELTIETFVRAFDEDKVKGQIKNSFSLRLTTTDADLAGHPLLSNPWRLEYREVNAKPWPSQNGIILIFKEKEIALSDGLGLPEGQRLYWLRPEVSVNAIDILDGKNPLLGGVEAGIWEISGDTLKICTAALGRPRPKEFSTSPNSTNLLQVFKRLDRLPRVVVLQPLPSKDEPPKKDPPPDSIYAKFKEVNRIGKGGLAMAFGVDGKHVFAATGQEVLQWELATAQIVRRFSVPGQVLKHLAIAPDGLHLLTAGGRALTWWEISSGRKVFEFDADPKDVGQIVLSPDGKMAASTGAGEKAIRLWDLIRGKPVRTIDVGHKRAHKLGLAFSPDSKKLASGAGPEQVVLWDVDNGRKELVLPCKGEPFLFLPDGKRLLVSDGLLRLYQLPDGKELRLYAESNNKQKVQLAADARHIVAGGSDFVWIWNLDHPAPVARFLTPGWIGAGFALAPDGKRLVTAEGGFAKLWALPDDPIRTVLAKNLPPEISAFKPVARYRPHVDGGLAALGFSPDGKWLATAGAKDNLVRFFSAATGKEIRTFSADLLRTTCLAVFPDGSKVLTGGGFLDRENLRFLDPDLHLWNVKTGKEERRLIGHRFGASAVAVSPNQKLALSSSIEGAIRLWDLKSGRQLHEFPTPVNRSARNLSFSPDGQTALAAFGDNVLVLDLKNLREARSFPAEGDAFFLADGKTAITLGGKVTLWDVNLGTEKKIVFTLDYGVNTADLSRDGRRALLSDNQSKAHVVDLAAGKVLAVLAPGGPTRMFLAPDGNHVVLSKPNELTLVQLPLKSK